VLVPGGASLAILHNTWIGHQELPPKRTKQKAKPRMKATMPQKITNIDAK
jgi:hypothetical protein